MVSSKLAMPSNRIKRSRRYMAWFSTDGGKSSSNLFPRALHAYCKVTTRLPYASKSFTDRTIVRLKVQFQSIPDAFPHDIVYSFESPAELSEPAIGVHTMLAPSVGSMTSSTSSLRRQRLNEISEDAEDGPIRTPEPAATPPIPEMHEPESMPRSYLPDADLDDLPASALRAKALLALRNSPDIDTSSHSPTSTRQLQSHVPSRKPVPAQQPRNDSSPRSEVDSPPFLPPITSITDPFDKELPTPPAETNGGFEATSRDDAPPRPPHERSNSQLTTTQLNRSPHLTVGASESISLWSSEVSQYAAQPKKKKLGPRPHVEAPGRPRTSGASENNIKARPVANLPTSVKIATERSRTPMSLRPSSQHSTKSVPGRFPSSQSVSNLPPLPSPTQIMPYYKAESRSVIHHNPSITSEISTTATPEKMRLMKALQLRKKNQLTQQRGSINPSIMFEQNGNGHAIESKLGSSSTTPTTATIASEGAEDSSYTSRDDAANRRGSLSSDTSSSITPKAEAEPKPKTKAKLEVPRKRERQSKLAAPPIVEVDSDDESRPRSDAGNPVEAFARLTSSPEQPKTVPKPDRVPMAPNPRQSILSNFSLRSKKNLPKALQIPNNADASGESDAESFMDELANATVHEAKPVKVGRTPATPVLAAPMLREVGDPNRYGENGTQLRSKSSNFAIDKPKSSGGRSSSALPVWPPMPAGQHPQPLTKKSSLGTGISKRIKALEVLSTRDSTSPPRQPVRDIPSKRSAFDTFMKRSSLKQAPNTSTDRSPPKKVPEASSNTADFRHPAYSNAGDDASSLFTSAPKVETVSVTARIIRNHDDVPPSTAPGDITLHRSPLIVEHERIDDNRSIMSRVQEGPLSPQKPEKGRFSFSSYRSMTQSATQSRLNTADSMSRVSLSSKGKVPRSMSDNVSLSDDKKSSSRAQRLMKRVTNLTGRRSHKNLTSPSQADFHRDDAPETIDERFEPDHNGSVSESLLHVVDIGDVNVQFPDTVLWKRRFMRVDDQGYIIFSPPTNDHSTRSVSRKFHLSDFRTPTLPDLEREQMAWSVFLDMRDGSCIQCACENRAAQQQVLQSKYIPGATTTTSH